MILKEDCLNKEEVFKIINSSFDGLRKLLACVEKIIDIFSFAWKIVKKWNIKENENRLKDGSITFENFIVTDEKITYRINKFMYYEIF